MVANLYVDCAGLPPKIAFAVRRHLRDYSRLVINKEWPAQQAGHVNTEAWMPLFKLNLGIARFRPAEGTRPIEAEFLHTANPALRSTEGPISGGGFGDSECNVGSHPVRWGADGWIQLPLRCSRLSAPLDNDRDVIGFAIAGDRAHCRP